MFVNVSSPRLGRSRRCALLPSKTSSCGFVTCRTHVNLGRRFWGANSPRTSPPGRSFPFQSRLNLLDLTRCGWHQDDGDDHHHPQTGNEVPCFNHSVHDSLESPGPPRKLPVARVCVETTPVWLHPGSPGDRQWPWSYTSTWMEILEQLRLLGAAGRSSGPRVGVGLLWGEPRFTRKTPWFGTAVLQGLAGRLRPGPSFRLKFLFKKICLNQGLSKTACGQKSLFRQMLQITCKAPNLQICSFKAISDISIRARIGVILA